MTVRVADPFGLVELDRTFSLHRRPHRHAQGGRPAGDPAGRGLDRLGRQPAARLRRRQRRGRHGARVPPRRRPAPGPLALQRPRRRAHGPPRGAALAVPRHALHRQPRATCTAAPGRPPPSSTPSARPPRSRLHLAQRGFRVRLVTADGTRRRSRAGTSTAPRHARPVRSWRRSPCSARSPAPTIDASWLNDAHQRGSSSRCSARPAGRPRGAEPDAPRSQHPAGDRARRRAVGSVRPGRCRASRPRSGCSPPPAGARSPPARRTRCRGVAAARRSAGVGAVARRPLRPATPPTARGGGALMGAVHPPSRRRGRRRGPGRGDDVLHPAVLDGLAGDSERLPRPAALAGARSSPRPGSRCASLRSPRFAGPAGQVALVVLVLHHW